jgi:hypothetical protein
VLGDARHEGRIISSQAHALVPLVLAPGSELFHAARIERAAEVTVRRLEDDVEHALATGASVFEMPLGRFRSGDRAVRA